MLMRASDGQVPGDEYGSVRAGFEVYALLRERSVLLYGAGVSVVSLHSVLAVIERQMGNQFVGGGLVLMFTGSLVALCRSLPARWYAWFKSRFTRVITIESVDPLFDYVTYWLNSQERFTRSRYLRASTELRLKQISNQDNDGPSMESTAIGVGSVGNKKRQQLKVFYSPSHGRHFFRYAGMWVSIAYGSHTSIPGSGATETIQGGSRMPEKETYQLEEYGKGTGQALKSLIAEIVAFGTQETEGVRVYYNTWGHWSSNGYQVMRPLSTVVLPEGFADGVLADMEKFRRQRDWYRDLGIPWHKGYLFHGLPGTGKSSLAAACAGELDMDVYLMSLSGTAMTDETLQNLMANVRSGSMVILEDIDCTVPDRDAPVSAGGRVTLSGLLNCLDGIMSREGCPIVMTTNRRDVLDDALLRPGRVDFEAEFGHADRSQIVRLAARIGVSADGLQPGTMTMAEVQKELLDRYERAQKAVAA